MKNKKTKRTLERTRRTHAARYFARIAALNELIDKGGEAAKDAAAAKVNLSNQCEWKSSVTREARKKHKSHDVLDSRKRLPGSYESGKRR